MGKKRGTDGWLDPVHNIGYRVTELTWRHLTNGTVQFETSGPSSKFSLDSKLTPKPHARLPERIYEAVTDLMASYDIDELAMRLSGVDPILHFHQDRYNTKTIMCPDKIAGYHFNGVGPDVFINWDGSFERPSRKNKKQKPILILVSESVPQLTEPEGTPKNCFVFLPLSKKRAKSLNKSLESGMASEKMKAVANYRLLSNMLTTIVAPALKSIMRYSKYSMANALSKCLVDEKHHLAYPWKRDSGVPTTTLVLDIRKSTFAMSFALSERSFANWMRITIRLLRRISDKYSAIFDKFTGDGVMVHFAPIEYDENQYDHLAMLPDGDYREVRKSLNLNHTGPFVDNPQAYKDNAQANEVRLVMAYCCAWEMMIALEYHTSTLRSLLTRGHGGLGATVALGMANATWSLDRDGNPIVVGPGVVGACRAVDSAEPSNLVVSPTVLSRLKALRLDAGNWNIVPSAKSDVDGNEQYYSTDKQSDKLPIYPTQILNDIRSDYAVFGFEDDIKNRIPLDN